MARRRGRKGGSKGSIDTPFKHELVHGVRGMKRGKKSRGKRRY